MTMIDFAYEQKESYSASTVRWQELFLCGASFVCPLFGAEQLPSSATDKGERALVTPYNQGACPACDSQSYVSIHCTPD